MKQNGCYRVRCIFLTSIYSTGGIGINCHFAQNEEAIKNLYPDLSRTDSSTRRNNGLPRRNFAGKRFDGHRGFSLILPFFKCQSRLKFKHQVFL